jgi:transcriptional regulator with XRE-family HTH domain
MAEQAAPRPSDVVSARVERARRNQGITVQQLAARCAELGVPELSRDVITNIEQRRRRVTIDEVWVLAAALNIPPNLLMLPLGDEQRVQLAPAVTIHPHLALDWAEGDLPLVHTNQHTHTWPEPDTPDWVAAAAPLYLYHELRAHERALRNARTPGERKDALERLRAHIEGDMARAGLDERAILADHVRGQADAKEEG